MWMISARRVRSSLGLGVALALALAVGGCAEARPAAETSESLTEERSDASASEAVSLACSPGATRECKTFWYDREAHVHCRLGGQVCRSDGRAWQACGELDAGAAPDASSDVDAGSD